MEKIEQLQYQVNLMKNTIKGVDEQYGTNLTALYEKLLKEKPSKERIFKMVKKEMKTSQKYLRQKNA